jgi:serine/threonine protein kinase
MADMWAAGIIMYELITGNHPFYKVGETKQQIIGKLSIIKEFPYPETMSPQARHLIQRLCCRETA